MSTSWRVNPGRGHALTISFHIVLFVIEVHDKDFFVKTNCYYCEKVEAEGLALQNDG